jgi:predicted RNA binding protein YcfA (HicA-like mRNA interferase family)
MPKLPIISGDKVIKALTKIGYFVTRKRGSHFRLHHSQKQPITIPDHKIIGKGLLRKILRDVELSVVEFIKLIKK